MDGENNGKPYEQMDDLGGNPLFLETPISIQSKERDPATTSPSLPVPPRPPVQISHLSTSTRQTWRSPWHRGSPRLGRNCQFQLSLKQNTTNKTVDIYFNLPGKKQDQSTCILMVLKFFFQREDNEMLQNNTFRKWSLCDNASVSTFASVSYIDPCQVSSHHGIISIISFHYFPTER